MSSIIRKVNNKTFDEVEIWNEKDEFITNKIEKLNVEQRQDFITVNVPHSDSFIQKVPSKLTVIFSCTVLDVSLYSEFCEMCANWAALRLKIKQKRTNVIEIIKYGQWQETTFVFNIEEMRVQENNTFTMDGFINRQL